MDLGIDVKPFIMEKENIVIVGGPFKPWKRTEDVIRAFSSMPENWQMVMFGVFEDESYHKQIQKLIIELRLSGRIAIKGRITDDEKWALYQKAKISMAAGRKEGFGLTVFESQAYGCVPIAYKTKGLSEAIEDGITGILVKDGDWRNLAAALLRLLMDKELWEELSENGMNKTKSSSWDNVYQHFKSQFLLTDTK